MPNDAERVVFDCVVFAQTLISDTGPSAGCMELARSRQISLIWSAYVVQEVRELPMKLKPKYGVTAERVEAFIHDIAGFAEFIDDVPSRYINPLDADDSPYIDLALAAGANLITSWNHDFRSLMDPGKPAGKDFLARFPRLLVLTPVELLERIRGTGKSA